MTKTIVGIAALVGIGLCAANAGAAGKVRVGVVALRGAGEGPVRAKISAALKANGFQVVGTQQLESSASGLGVTLDGDAGFRAVAKELNIAAFVVGEMTKKRAELTVRNGADGAVLGEAAFPGANPKKIAGVVGSEFWRQLGSVVKQGRPPSGAKAKAVIAEEAPPADEEPAAAEPPPPPPEKKKKGSKKAAEPAPEAAPEPSESAKPAKAAKAEAVAEEEEETSTGGRAPVALAVGVGGRALFRRLDWNQNVRNQVAPYALSPGPEAGIWFEAFPAAFVMAGFAANVGVFGDFNYGFGVTSTTTGANPARLTTKFQDFMGGLKIRLPIKSLAPYLSVAYGAQSFSLTSTTAMSPLPSVAYKFIRLGLGTRLNLSPQASVDVGAAYLLVTDPGAKAGEIKSAAYFPRATVSGIDVGASFGFRFTKILGARAGVDFRQYGFAFHVQSTDTGPIVGGATDRYITAWGGLEVVLDGIGGGGSSDDDEAEPEAPAPAAKSKGRKKKAAPPPEAEADADAEK